MKKKAIIFIFIFIFMLLTACAAPAQDNSSQPEASAVPASDQAIYSASELRKQIEQYRVSGNYSAIYETAIKLLELDPSDTEAYLTALDALLKTTGQSYDEMNRLLSIGADSAEDPAALADWFKNNQPDYSISMPFVPDALSPDEINSVGITTGNMTNCAKYDQYNGWWVGGLLTWQGDWVYLSRPDEAFAIYKMHTDGSEYQRVGEANGSCLNIIGDWLYFLDHFDGGRIYKIRTDGSMKGRIAEDSDCAFLSVAGEWMYFHNGSDNGCLYKMKTDGSGRKKLVDNLVIFACVAEDGYVYYAEKREDSGLYRIPTEGGASETVIACGKLSYALKDENGGNEVLLDIDTNAPQTYCVVGNWVYFFDSAQRHNVRRIRTDGTGGELVWPFNSQLTTMNTYNGVLSCSFGYDNFYEADGFVTGQEIVIMDISDIDTLHRVNESRKLQHVTADTEPICTGPDGYIYYYKYSEGMRWYGLSPDGVEFRIG